MPDSNRKYKQSLHVYTNVSSSKTRIILFCPWCFANLAHYKLVQFGTFYRFLFGNFYFFKSLLVSFKIKAHKLTSTPYESQLILMLVIINISTRVIDLLALWIFNIDSKWLIFNQVFCGLKTAAVTFDANFWYKFGLS